MSPTSISGPCILGTGAAYGNHYSNEEMVDLFHKQREAAGDTDYDKAFVNKVFSRLQYDTHSVQACKEDVFRTFTRTEYIQHRRIHLTDIAERACRDALNHWGGDPKDITHLYWGTMTGAMDSPTIDILLAKRLGLSLDVKRTSIEGMGCLTGYRLLNLATETVAKNPDIRILVIEADLRSLIGNSLPTKASRSDIISALLFRDGASAAVVGCSPRPGEVPHYEVLGGKSRIAADTHELVEYVELEEGAIRLHLDRFLPDAVEKAEVDFVKCLLDEARFGNDPHSKIAFPPLSDFDIACHTGGPKILQKVGTGLGLDDKEHLKASWKIMKANGNLSGASNLAVLNEQNRSGGRNWVICLSMGPGICVEGLVMRRPNTLVHPLESHPLTSLGDSSVDTMVNEAISKKKQEGHISTNYLGHWSKMKMGVLALIVLADLGLWIGTIFALMNQERLVTASILAPLAALLTSITACFFFRIEDAAQLSFYAILTFHMGALVMLISGAGYISERSDLDSLSSTGSLIGTILLTCGMTVFSYTSFIYQDWQYMVQHPILSLAFLLRTSTAVMWTDRDLLNDLDSYLRQRYLTLDVASTICFLIGLAFGLSKSYKKMQAPWLTPPNYQAYGIMLYGLGEVVGNGALVFIRLAADTASPGTAVVDTTSRAVLFCASALLLLDTARTAYKLEKTLDYSSPATAVLARGRLGLYAWSGICFAMILAGILHFIAHVGFDISDTEQDGLQFGGNLFAIIGSVALFVSLTVQQVSCTQTKKEEPFNLRLQIVGASILSSGFTIQALRYILEQGKNENDLGFLCMVGGILTLIGSLVLGGVFWLLPQNPWSVIPWQPTSWIHIVHSNNYYLLSFFYLFMSSLMVILGQHELSAVALIMCGVTGGLHNAMAWYVWSMTHTVESNDKTTTTTSFFNGKSKTYNTISQEPSQVDESVDVFINGAGPTGLLLASILGRHGIKVMIVEARPGPVTDARWTVINSASLEHLSKALDPDLFNQLRSRAMPDSTPLGTMLVTGMAHEDATVVEQATTPSRGTLMEEPGAIPDLYETRSLGSKHCRELPIRANQSHQEAVLKQQATRWPSVQLLYSHKTVDIQVVRRQDDDGNEIEYVVCNVENCDDCSGYNKSFTVKSRFIVGCDGPKSFVASKLQIPYDGFLNLAKTRSVLARAPGLYKQVLDKVGGTFMYQILRPKFGFAGVVAADPKEHMWNFLMMFGKETREASAQEICEEFLGTKDVEPVQDRFWYWNFFVARQLKCGPGFLAGDAAHSWPPFGATGGNQGYGDVANLGWKISAVCKCWGSDELLESYHSERRQAAIHTALFVLNHSPRPDLITKVLPMSRWPVVREWFSALWLYQNSGSHNGNHFSQAGTQLGTKYSHSQAVCSESLASLRDDPFCEYHPVVQNGARLPYCEVLLGDETTKNARPIYDLVALSGFTLFVIKDKLDTTGSTWISQFLTDKLVKVFESRGSAVNVQYIPKSSFERILQEQQGGRADAARQLVKEQLILVRPDHVVCWHWSGDKNNNLFFVDSGNDDNGSCDPDKLCASIADIVTGRGDCSVSHELRRKQQEQFDSYQNWLTVQFMNNLRPFMFNFPRAVPITNDFKDSAVRTVKATIQKRAVQQSTRFGLLAQSNRFINATGNNNLTVPTTTTTAATPFKNEYDVTTANITRNDEKHNRFVMGSSYLSPSTEKTEVSGGSVGNCSSSSNGGDKEECITNDNNYNYNDIEAPAAVQQESRSSLDESIEVSQGNLIMIDDGEEEMEETGRSLADGGVVFA